MKLSPFRSPLPSLPGKPPGTDGKSVFANLTFWQMKLNKDFEGTLYAVAVATGVSAATKASYANILVSSVDKPAKRSAYSIFLDLNDQEELSKLGITDVDALKNEDGSRKVTPLPQAVPLGEGKLGTVEHSPYGVRKEGSDKPVFYYTTSVVALDEDNVPLSTVADRALRRAYERADCFAKGDAFLADYRKYVVFALERDELEDLLVPVKEVEE